MPLQPNVNWSGNGLDFFVRCQAIYDQARGHVAQVDGESALKSLKRDVMSDLHFVHDLPLQAMNDRLKRIPFVDPHPFDDLVAEMLGEVLEWLEWVTRPSWLTESLEELGAKNVGARSGVVPSEDRSPRIGSRASSMDEALYDLESHGRFMYQMPLRLRDLQAMVRPFMEVRSTHYIASLDSMVAALVCGMLRLYQSVKAWDEAIAAHFNEIAHADMMEDPAARSYAIADLCAKLDIDPFEASHKLSKVDANLLALRAADVEAVCTRIPLLLDRASLLGPPTSDLQHAGVDATRRTRRDHIGGRLDRRTARSDIDFGEGSVSNASFSGAALDDARSQAFDWWHDQNFKYAAPSRVVAIALLDTLVEMQLHPDPWVAQMLPTTLERLFGVQISCYSFMNTLLPMLGGYDDSKHREIAPGMGLPVKRDPERCAETLLVFLRQWSELMLAEDESTTMVSKATNAATQSKRRLRKRGSTFVLKDFLDEVTKTGHSVEDVWQLLNGIKSLPGEILKAQTIDERYCCTGFIRRRWEFMTEQFADLIDIPPSTDRDLGPYVHVELDKPGHVAEIWGNQPRSSWCLVNPDLISAAKRGYSMDDVDAVTDSQSRGLAMTTNALSDTFALKLIQWPEEFGSGDSATSTFVKFFSDQRMRISRRCLQGLPELPWCIGSDERNTVIMDAPGPGIAPFHCMLAQSKFYAKRVCCVPLGDPLSSSYIICPKYQPWPIRNGDRLVCHQWTFELQIKPTKNLHESILTILTDEGTVFEVSSEGCHIGAGNRSRHMDNQPCFPQAKFALKHRLRDISPVHVAIWYQAPVNRWTIVDHSPHPMGCLLQMRPCQAYPLSHGLRLMMGQCVLEVMMDDTIDA